MPESALTSNSNSAEAPPHPGLASESSHFPLLDISVQLLGNWVKVTQITVGFVVIAAIICLILPTRYTATAKIMPPQQSQSGLSVISSQLFSSASTGSLAALAGGAALGLKSPNDIYIGILQSRLVADDLIGKYNLMSVYRSKDMTACRKKLKQNTDIVSEKSGVISVAITDSDKQRAALIANSYVEELRKLTNSMAVTEADRRLEFFSKRLDEKKEALDEAEKRLKEVQQNKSVLQPEIQGRATVEQITALERQISAKEVQLKVLGNYSTRDNPQVQLLSSEIASLKQQLSQLQQQSFGKDSIGSSAQDLPGANLAYFNAEHELRYRQTMFDLLSRQYDAALLDTSKDAAVIQILEPAIAPDRKSFPHIGTLLALAALAGILCGCGWVILLWKTEDLRGSELFQRKLRALRAAIRQKHPPLPNQP